MCLPLCVVVRTGKERTINIMWYGNDDRREGKEEDDEEEKKKEG